MDSSPVLGFFFLFFFFGGGEGGVGEVVQQPQQQFEHPGFLIDLTLHSFPLLPPPPLALRLRTTKLKGQFLFLSFFFFRKKQKTAQFLFLLFLLKNKNLPGQTKKTIRPMTLDGLMEEMPRSEALILPSHPHIDRQVFLDHHRAKVLIMTETIDPTWDGRLKEFVGGRR